MLAHTKRMTARAHPPAGALQGAGNRTEVALLRLGRLLGCDMHAVRARRSVLCQASFSSDRKRMTTVVELARDG